MNNNGDSDFDSCFSSEISNALTFAVSLAFLSSSSELKHRANNRVNERLYLLITHRF
jgi:hypothetical protein